jgi:nitroreductase
MTLDRTGPLPGLADVDTVLTTTRAVRKRLDLHRPVPREVVEECARIAFQAPNGSNEQHWGWVFVDDPALRAEMARIYRDGMADVHREREAAGTAPDNSSPERQRMVASVRHLADHLHEVPVLLVPTVTGRLERESLFVQASRWGTVCPGVWSLMLALRSRGLGSVWTTVHLTREKEMAELLGIPDDQVTQAGLFPIAYTLGTDFSVADRSDTRVRWNHW